MKKKTKKRIPLQLPLSSEKFKLEAAPRNADNTGRCAGAGSREKCLDTYYFEINSYWF